MVAFVCNCEVLVACTDTGERERRRRCFITGSFDFFTGVETSAARMGEVSGVGIITVRSEVGSFTGAK